MAFPLDIPPPRHWQDFEDFCCELWRQLWKDPNARKHGSQGQPQAGVDIYGQPKGDRGWAGVQCKLKRRGKESGLTEHEIRSEVEKAGAFRPRLEHFVIATTAERDIKAQRIARQLTEDPEVPFSVSIAAWDDIIEDLAGEELVARHWGRWRRTRQRRAVASGVASVPGLPPHYLPRPEYSEKLKKALLQSDRSRLGLTGVGKVGVQGMGGIGKTVLAAAVAHDPEIKRAFSDGVLWITVGQEPNIVELQQELASLQRINDTVFHSERQGKLLLNRALGDQALLLILDDVWRPEHAALLDVVGSEGKLLVTTRNREVLVNLGAKEIQIEVLSRRQARLLLGDWAGQPDTELPSLADHVAEACGFLPLALSMIGAIVRLEPTAWGDALHRLEHADLEKIRQDFPDYPYPNLLRALAVSVESLAPRDRKRYLELAVFPEGLPVPQAAIEVLWSTGNLDSLESRELIRRLTARSLLRRDEESLYRLHDLQGHYIRRKARDLPALHRRLVGAYKAHCPDGLASGPDDGYFFEQMPYHLARSLRVRELREMLSDFNWLSKKMHLTTLQSVISDFELLPSGDKLIRAQAALRLAAHVLARSPEELASQLYGRLDSRDGLGIQSLLRSAYTHSKGHHWLQPIYRSLEPPGGPLFSTLEGHAAAVSKVVVLPDSRVVSASDDRTLRVWDANSCETLSVLKGHSDVISVVTPLHDNRVVSGSNDGTLRIWDTDSGETLHVMAGHSRTITDVVVLDDGCIASASDDRTLRVWDTDSGEALCICQGHEGTVWAIAALPDRRIVSASFDKTLRVWDLDSGEALHVFHGHEGPVTCIAVLDAEHLISGSRDTTLRVWTLNSDREIRILKGHSLAIWGVASLPNGQVVSGSFDRTMRVWDADSGQELFVLPGHSGEACGIAVLPDARIASASFDGALRVWDSSSGEILATLRGHSSSVRDLAVLPGERAVTASFDGTLRVWNAASVEDSLTSERHMGWVTDVAIMSDGHLASSSMDHTIKIWCADTGEQILTLEGHADAVLAVTVFPDGRLASASKDRTVRIWDATTAETLHTFEGHVDWVTDVSVLPDGRIVSASRDRTLRLWDTKSGKTAGILEGHSDFVRAVAALSDNRIVSASDDRTLRLWDTNSGKTLKILRGHSNWIWGVSVLPDDRIVSASHDGTLRIWKANSGEELGSLVGHTGVVTDVTSLSTKWIVSSSVDRTLRVWDLDRETPLAVFHADSTVLCIGRGHKSKTVVAGDRSGRVHFLRFHTPG